MSRYRVLLVEPNAELRRILRDFLGRSELEVFEASNFTAAVTSTEGRRPDLIVCEAELPGPASGLDLVRSFKNHTAFSAAPLLIITEAAAPEDRLDSLSSGGDDYLLKPFSMRELVYRCERLIDYHHRPKEPSELSGDLARFKSSDILQLLEANQSTGVLHIDGDRAGEIHLLDGHICGSFSDDLTGEDAAYRLIPVRNGRFHFVRADIRSNVQAIRSTTEFMMEAFRRHDEKANQPAS
ncbi:MAG TPA: response regulator [Vicinamibacteria bacterium]|nr:response regulator [Vicinamibacteria bacterium]